MAEAWLDEVEVNSAYKLEMNWDREDVWRGWRLIWRLCVQQRVEDCLWVLSHDHLLTTFGRWQRGLSSTAKCEGCDKLAEDILHVVRDCKFAREVWFPFFPQNRLIDFFSLNLRDWVLRNLSLNSEPGEDLDWPRKMSLIVWALWR